MDIANIMIFNVSGLNKKSHRDTVWELIASYHPELIFLQETKLVNMSTRVLLMTLGVDINRHVCLPANGTRGGILIAWREESIRMITSRVDSYLA